ncbi:MAG: hypothetical protein JWN57_2829, partial [Frankiales bacterium]|nr:hypothetical protein [Frankiales bacterium]
RVTQAHAGERGQHGGGNAVGSAL